MTDWQINNYMQKAVYQR